MLILSIFLSGCSVTRKLSDGEYFLQSVKIEDDKQTPKKERIPAYTLDEYVRQSPNTRFLGTNFYVWAYNLADPQKQNWWNNLKRKIGEEPTLLDLSLTHKSAQNLKTYMDSRGYYASEVSYEIDTTRRAKRAYVTFRTHQGEPYNNRFCLSVHLYHHIFADKGRSDFRYYQSGQGTRAHSKLPERQRLLQLLGQQYRVSCRYSRW